MPNNKSNPNSTYPKDLKEETSKSKEDTSNKKKDGENDFSLEDTISYQEDSEKTRNSKD